MDVQVIEIVHQCPNAYTARIPKRPRSFRVLPERQYMTLCQGRFCILTITTSVTADVWALIEWARVKDVKQILVTMNDLRRFVWLEPTETNYYRKYKNT